MLLRPATPADLPLLQRWERAPHVAAAAGDEDFNDWDWENQLGRAVPWREMLIAEADGGPIGRPIGFVQIIDPAEEESHYWGDCPAGLRAIDIWIGEADCIRRGFGRQMMRLALARCFGDPAVTAVLVDPLADNAGAHRFYEAMGFRPVGPRSFGPDSCLVYSLERARWREGSDACPPC
jgi:aminoglycoside 6'-N-acetyltransferase